MIPEGYQLKAVHGFVEELVFADDPEYQWIDKIRTPRSTNEARQTLFFKLNGQVKRKIGLKVMIPTLTIIFELLKCVMEVNFPGALLLGNIIHYLFTLGWSEY